MSDHLLDEQLRDVIAPPDLAARIKAALCGGNTVPSALALSDGQLDQWLRDVVVPEALAARLVEIPADISLDKALANVSAPLTLAPSVRLVTTRQRLGRLGRRVARLALAASWFVAISAALGAGLAGLLSSSYLGGLREEESLVIIYDGPLSLAGDLADSADQAATQPILVVDSQYNAGNAPLDNPNAAQPAGLSIEDPQLAHAATAGVVAQWVSLVHSGMRPLDDAVLLRFGLLGSPQYTDDRLPELDAPLMPRASGIQPPLVRGYDRAFFQKHRIFPPISPAANPQLASLAVPLVTESDVLARLSRALADDRRLPPGELRVEDFLAAMNYRFAPAPAGRAALRTAAGPAPFGQTGTGLLQVGVQTGSLAIRPQPCTHLVLAIDLSQSMRWAGRLEMLQQAIDWLLDQLRDDDRLSLIVFNEEVTHRVELATRGDAAELRALVADLSPRGGTNLAAGLQQAASIAMVDGLPAGSTKRLVLITDSQVHLSPATLDSLRGLLIDAREAQVRLDVLDLSDDGEVDPVLVEWAENLGGDVRTADGGRALAWSLAEALAGGSPVVASDAKLTLHFNPEAVAAYRLIGHEANPLADLVSVAVEAELAAGESATALVEVWFRPGEHDDVGRAELAWRDSAGYPHSVSQRISRLQFAPTLAESALSLQQAAIAAEVGQTLRGTRDALREVNLKPVNARGLAGVLAAAGRVHPQVRERPDFQRLLAVARQLERVYQK